jgi:CBS domain-containing protein
LRLRELRKGSETYIITNADVASKKVNETLFSAEKEIMILTSSKGITEMWKNKALLKNWQEKSVAIKIMAPITSENLENARKLSKQSEIKHIATCHSLMTIVDAKHLFQFKAPLPNQEKFEEIAQFESTLYTNDLEYVQRTKDVLNWIWKNASDLSRIIVGSIARMPIPIVTGSTPVFEIASIMAKRNMGAVIVARDFEPLGIVTERDIIERVILAKKDPHEVVAQEIMTAPLITIHYDRTIEEALEIMRKNHVRRIVVVKGESLAGLLTERRLLLASVAGHA